MTKEEAEVTLKVNSEQAKKEFEALENKATQLRAKFADAYRKGDTRGIKEINDELNKVNREMNRMRLNAANIRAAMKRLDEATPKEIQNTIKLINQELGSGRIKRGSKEWQYYTNQLKLAHAELKKVQAEMRETESFFSRANRKVNDWATSIAAGAAAFAGVTLAGKAAVQTYADMEAEEASVKKYTGMTKEEVASLNEEFKKMDTRTARAELNRLAQEAGRLGKTSKEDVHGFVKASNQINVALDELGDDATRELSKLTSIFGDEKRLGTEKALLSVGSVINELSQNCTAGASYLVDYSQRMAGVGAQAHLTIPQIMSYAAVLDSQGQNVEAAATAMSQLIMKMYQDPAKIAKAAGMDVKEFSEILKKDANEALLTLLKTLGSYGGIEKIASIFDEMGTDGARASAAIAALAGNVDMLVWEQGEANKAFREATSVTKEYEVQNTTVQAKLDKSRKKFTEMAVTLGEKLLPAMTYSISGTSMLMEVMNVLFDFFIEHKKVILTTTAAIVAYNAVIELHNAKVKIATTWTGLWTAANTKMNGVMAISKLGWAALANGVQYFTNGLQVNYAMQERWRKAMAAMNFASWIGLVLAVGSALYLLSSRTKEATTAQERLQKIRESAVESASEEINRIKQLVKFAEDETNALEDRLKVVGELNNIIPNYNALIDQTTGKYKASTEALNKHIESLIRLYEIEGAKDQLKSLGKEKSDATVEYRKAKRNADSAKATRNQGKGYTYTSSFGYVGNTAMDSASFFQSEVNRLEDKLADISKREQEIIDAYGKDVLIERKVELETTVSSTMPDITLSKGESEKERKASEKAERERKVELETTVSSTMPDITLSKGESEKERKAREKAERERKKREREETAEEKRLLKEHLETVSAARHKEDALNLASYTSGQKNYLEYTEAKASIEEKYIADSLKVLEEHGKKDSEKYSKLLEQREKLQKESSDRVRKASLFDVEQDHKGNEDKIVSDFYDPNGTLFQNQKALNQRLLDEDVRYLTAKRDLYSEGSDEWIKLNAQIEERIAWDKLDKQREMAEGLLRYSKEYQEMDRKSREEAEIKLLDKLKEMGLISEMAYQIALRSIREKFRKEEIDARQKEIDDRHDVIENEFNEVREIMAGSMDPFGNALVEMAISWAKLMDDMKNEGEGMWNSFGDFAAHTLSLTGALISQYSSYVDAERDVELAKIEKRYDKEIEAAGNNTKKKEQLEKEKEQKIAKTKKQYASRAMKLEISQALAQTAANAILGYQAGLEFPFPANTVMPHVLAGLAVAQGMIQVATIRKQHQAEAAGYYSGGFTKRDPDNRKEVGVVHANEFVANHKAVANPALSPILGLIDHAQRTNTVGSITADDVSNALGKTTGVSARGGEPAPAVRDKAIAESIAALSVVSAENRAVIEKLSRQIEDGIYTSMIMDGEQGFHRKYVKYQKLLNNPKR